MLHPKSITSVAERQAVRVVRGVQDVLAETIIDSDQLSELAISLSTSSVQSRDSPCTDGEARLNKEWIDTVVTL